MEVGGQVGVLHMLLSLGHHPRQRLQDGVVGGSVVRIGHPALGHQVVAEDTDSKLSKWDGLGR